MDSEKLICILTIRPACMLNIPQDSGEHYILVMNH